MKWLRFPLIALLVVAFALIVVACAPAPAVPPASAPASLPPGITAVSTDPAGWSLVKVDKGFGSVWVKPDGNSWQWKRVIQSPEDAGRVLEAYRVQERILGESVIIRFEEATSANSATIYLKNLGEPVLSRHLRIGWTGFDKEMAEGYGLYRKMFGAGWLDYDPHPENLVVNENGRVAIADLGSAHPVGETKTGISVADRAFKVDNAFPIAVRQWKDLHSTEINAVEAGLSAPPSVSKPAVVLKAQVPAKFRILVVGCDDGRCLEQINGTKTEMRYFRRIAGTVPESFGAIVAAEEKAMGAPFDLIVAQTHDGFCGVGGCGGQDLLDKLLKDPNLIVAPELEQTKVWVKANITSPNTFAQAVKNGDDIVRLTGGNRTVLVAPLNTNDQLARSLKFWTPGQGWSANQITQSQWQAAQASGWNTIPELDLGVLPESAKAFVLDNRAQAPALAQIAQARNFRMGQTFSEVVVTSSLRPVSARLGLGVSQGERFVATIAEGMTPADINAQIAYALGHAKTGTEGLPATNVRFLYERSYGVGLDWAPELAAADVNPAFRKWMGNPAMKGVATFEVWDEMIPIIKSTLRPSGVPLQSFLMSPGGAGAAMLIPGIFFAAANLASRPDVIGSQSFYNPNAAAAALPEEFLLKESSVYRVHVGPDPTTMWSQLIDRVPAGREKACVKRALTDLRGALLLMTEDIPTMLSVCPNRFPVTSELVGAAIVYAVPNSSQEPIVIAYRDGKWQQVLGSTLEYLIRVQNKAGVPFQAVFKMAWVNGKETHTFVRLVCGPPGFGDKLAICPK